MPLFNAPKNNAFYRYKKKPQKFIVSQIHVLIAENKIAEDWNI